MSTRSWRRILPWMTAYAIAMAFLESAIVVDLRALYYPEGFVFPLVRIEDRLAWTEILREAATLVMLIAVGALVTTDRWERFAWTCYAFGVWDLFYYVFLKAILGWPESLLTWDILFLLPVPWTGPVLAPCVVSLGLIALAVLVLQRKNEVAAFRIPGAAWAMFLASGAIMLWTFVEGPLGHLWAHGPGLHREEVLSAWADHVPDGYDWPLFLVACGLGVAALVRLARRTG